MGPAHLPTEWAGRNHTQDPHGYRAAPSRREGLPRHLLTRSCLRQERSVDASQEIAAPPSYHDNRGGRVLLTVMRVLGHVTNPRAEQRPGLDAGLSGTPGTPFLTFPSPAKDGPLRRLERDGVGEDRPGKCLGPARPELSSGLLRGQRLSGLGLARLALAFSLLPGTPPDAPNFRSAPEPRLGGVGKGCPPGGAGGAGGPED